MVTKVDNSCNTIIHDNIKNFYNENKDKIEKFKTDFNTEYSKDMIFAEFRQQWITYTTNNSGDNKQAIKNIINGWEDKNYDKYFGSDNELDKLLNEIHQMIKRNDIKVEKYKTCVGKNKALYNAYKTAYKNAKDSSDASGPRRKVRKQVLEKKYLFAFIYLSAILGGSYYIYRFFKK